MIGQNFSPTDQTMGQRPQPTGAVDPLQQAIQVLQLRMPHVYGANAPAPSPLLQSQGAPMGFNLQAVLQHLLGIAPQQGMGLPGGTAGPGPMAPIPSGPRVELPPGSGGPAAGGTAPPFTPAVHYQPPPMPPGGTAGPGPIGPYVNRPGPPNRGRMA